MDGQDAGREELIHRFVGSHQHDAIGVVQAGGQLDEHVQSLPYAPAEGHSEEDLLSFQPVLFSRVSGGWAEHREVDAVMDHVDGVTAEEGLSDQVPQPCGGGDDRQIQPGKELLFPSEEGSAAVKKPAVFTPLRTVTASCLPPVTADHIEVGAVAREGPAVVEGPEDLDPAALKIGEQQLQIAVVAVDVVEMDGIGADPVQLGDHLLGDPFGIEAVITQHAGAQCLHFLVGGGAEVDAEGVIAASVGIEHRILDALLSQQAAHRHTDLAGASRSAGGVDLYDPFHVYVTYSCQKGT